MPIIQQQNVKVPFRIFKSCLLPNQANGNLQESFREVEQQMWEQKSTSVTIKSVLSSKEMRMCYIISIPLIILIAILYIYVVFEPKALPQQPSNPDLEAKQYAKRKATAECYSEFRLNKCSLDKPTGQVCVNLHRCITDHTAQTQEHRNNDQVVSSKSIKTVSKNKLETIEEVLENVLLIIGGGFGILMSQNLKNFRKLSRWLKAVIEKIIGFSQALNRHHQ